MSQAPFQPPTKTGDSAGEAVELSMVQALPELLVTNIVPVMGLLGLVLCGLAALAAARGGSPLPALRIAGGALLASLVGSGVLRARSPWAYWTYLVGVLGATAVLGVHVLGQELGRRIVLSPAVLVPALAVAIVSLKVHSGLSVFDRLLGGRRAEELPEGPGQAASGGSSPDGVSQSSSFPSR